MSAPELAPPLAPTSTDSTESTASTEQITDSNGPRRTFLVPLSARKNPVALRICAMDLSGVSLRSFRRRVVSSRLFVRTECRGRTQTLRRVSTSRPSPSPIVAIMPVNDRENGISSSLGAANPSQRQDLDTRCQTAAFSAAFPENTSLPRSTTPQQSLGSENPPPRQPSPRTAPSRPRETRRCRPAHGNHRV